MDICQKVLSQCALYFKEWGSYFTCKIIDSKRQYSRDLEQGGLEIPCLLLFQKLLKKACKLLLLSEKSTFKTMPSETPHKIKQ